MGTENSWRKKQMKQHSVVLIMTDQQRADTMHYLNPESPCVTPNLDALALDSVCFTNAYTNAPVCTPARSCIHTGLYPSVTGMRTNIYQQGCTTHEIADTPFLLSRRLQKAGYRCGYTGKWHLGLGKDKTRTQMGRELLKKREKGSMELDAYLDYGTLPSDIGFIGDDFPGHGGSGEQTEQFLSWLSQNGRTEQLEHAYGGNRPGDHSHGAEIVSGEKTTVQYYLAERAKKILDEISQAGDPFLLCVNYWGPHEPYNALKEDYDLYRNMPIPPWKNFTSSKNVENKLHRLVQRPEQDWPFFENNLRHYYALLTGIDRSIGAIISELKEKGLYDDSYIIFLADHGDSQGCHNGMENKSGHMYEETTKIPLMIKPPKGSPTGIRSGLASTVDIYATIMEIAGYDQQSYQAGHSLLPVLEDPEKQVRTYAVCESIGAFPLIGDQRMYREGKWKYIFNCGGSDELYDLESDPYEMQNRIDCPELADTVKTLRIGLAKAMYGHGDDAAPWYCKINHLLEWDDCVK